MKSRLTFEEWLASRYVPIAGADGDDDDPEGEGGVATADAREIKEAQERLDAKRKELLDRIGEMVNPNGEDKEEVKRREKELAEVVDHISKWFTENPSPEVVKLNQRLKRLERAPASEPTGLTMKGLDGRKVERKAYGGGPNLFKDMADAAREGDLQIGDKIKSYERQFRTEDRMKAWATGDLEAVDLVVPDIQAALPFLAAAAKVVALCRELRTTAPSVEFPVYTSGLTVDFVADGVTKPESTPTFDLVVARVYTIAGTTRVPNPTLEDYPVARGWISTELGRATGVKEDLAVLQGNGVGQPTGILNHSQISSTGLVADSGASAGRNIIKSIFLSIQKVRTAGFTEPTDVVLNPAVWTDVVLSFESNIGYLYGPPQGQGAPQEEPAPRILGLPVTQDSYVTTTYKGSTDHSPVIVGNFQDAVVLRRSPFRVDVDQSLGFRENMTWFRGEERMGFLVVRPKSFDIVTGIGPAAIT